MEGGKLGKIEEISPRQTSPKADAPIIIGNFLLFFILYIFRTFSFIFISLHLLNFYFLKNLYVSFNEMKFKLRLETMKKT